MRSGCAPCWPAYLSRVRGAAARADRIVVCNGFSQGLVLTLTALREAGVRRVAFEGPGYDETGRVAQRDRAPRHRARAGRRAGGATSTRWPDRVRGPWSLTPAHQWPTGVVLSPERRLALVRWAGEQDGYIVEDDYDAEFRYDHDPVGAVQGLAPDRTVLIGTVRKSLAPAVRLGWMVAPPALVDRIGELKLRHDRGSPGWSSWCWPGCSSPAASTGTCAGCGRCTPASGTPWSRRWPSTPRPRGSPGWPPASTRWSTCRRAPTRTRWSPRRRGGTIGLYGMGPYRASSYDDVVPQLVIGFGTLSERQIRQGIATVGDLLRA